MMTVLNIEKIFAREFKGYMRTLKEISSESKKGPSVVNDEEGLYFNFDEIKEKEVFEGAPEMPASPDTLIFKENEIVFVEFKNGKIRNIRKKKKEIKLKAIEGCFVVLSRIVEKYDFSFLDIIKLKKSYVLVYNDENNPRDEIVNRSDFAELEAALEIFKGTFFHNISVMPSNLFEEQFKKSRESVGKRGE
jgi:hypothetical protein